MGRPRSTEAFSNQIRQIVACIAIFWICYRAILANRRPRGRSSDGREEGAGRPGRHRRRDLYGTPELLLHKRMWDIVTRDKDGRAKEQSFSAWCRRIALHSETTSTATGDVTADSTATDHAESSAPFRALAEDILTHDLTEAQAKDPVYKLRKGKALTTRQRSTINAILRKNLGDARVCHFIFNHGIPTLLDVSLRQKNTQ